MSSKRSPYGSSKGGGKFIDIDDDFGLRLGASIVAMALVPLVMTIWWGVQHLFGSGTRYPYDQDRWQMAHFFTKGLNPSGFTPWLWAYLAILVIVLACIWGADAYDGQFAFASLMGVVLMFGCVGAALPGIISRGKVVGQFYQRGTTFYVTNPDDVPAALSKLVLGARKGVGGCDLKPIHDVPSCVKKGSLPDKPGLWQGRTSSYDGARTVLASATANQQGADLMESSLTYLGGESTDTEKWSGVIDGSGAYNPAQGVVEWYGKTGTVKKCLFNNKHLGTLGYKFNRAFGGAKRNSLSHKILSTYPGYMYDERDAWGYCDGPKPKYVVPMTEYVAFHHQVFKAPAGVLFIKGSETGDPIFDFRKDVKAGDIGGPVVPSSIVEKQRETLDWAAGRKYRKSTNGNNGGFGFDVASAETQIGNDSEYRLYRTDEKRWYYVTPLTPNNPKSQTYTAVALTPSDEVHAGQLPPLSVYLLDDDPAKQANADRLHAEALNYIGTTEPGFRQNGGELREIVPLGGDMWRIYAEVKGYTTHYIDMSSTGRVTPSTVPLPNVPGLSIGYGTGTPPGQPQSPGAPSVSPGQGKICQKDPAKMSTPEKVACIKAIADSMGSAQPTR